MSVVSVDIDVDIDRVWFAVSQFDDYRPKSRSLAYC